MLLWLLAAAGTICIILVIAGLWLNVSIMMFRTGSMEPTIETGSIALVHEIPAMEMSEGDVVTVDRGESLLPVTHRVTEITNVNEATGEVTFTMRGDANDVDDPEPYTTDTVKRAFFSIPGIAPVIQWFQNPYILGGLTLGATALVIWAFWPRDDEEDPTIRRTQRGKHRAHTIAVPTLLILTVPLVSMDQPSTTEHFGKHLRLRSTGDIEQMTNMAPGNSAIWVVDVWVDAPEPGPVELTVSAAGQLASDANGLMIEVALCSPHPESVTACADGVEPRVIDTAPLTDRETSVELATFSSDETRRVLLIATLAENAHDGLQDTTAMLQVTASGHHEEIAITPNADRPTDTTAPLHGRPVDLALSGFSKLWFLGVALIMISAGVLLWNARCANYAKRKE